MGNIGPSRFKVYLKATFLTLIVDRKQNVFQVLGSSEIYCNVYRILVNLKATVLNSDSRLVVQ